LRKYRSYQQNFQCYRPVHYRGLGQLPCKLPHLDIVKPEEVLFLGSILPPGILWPIGLEDDRLGVLCLASLSLRPYVDGNYSTQEIESATRPRGHYAFRGIIIGFFESESLSVRKPLSSWEVRRPKRTVSRPPIRSQLFRPVETELSPAVYPSGINVTLRPVKFTLARSVCLCNYARGARGAGTTGITQLNFLTKGKACPSRLSLEQSFVLTALASISIRLSLSVLAAFSLRTKVRVCFARFCFVAPPDTAERNCGSYLRIRWKEGLSEPGCPLELGTCKKGLWRIAFKAIKRRACTKLVEVKEGFAILAPKSQRCAPFELSRISCKCHFTKDPFCWFDI